TAHAGDVVTQVGTNAGSFFKFSVIAEKTGVLYDFRDSAMVANGHSLGGHLATAFARLFPDAVLFSNTFNGAGFNPWAEPAFAALELALRGEVGAYPGPTVQNNYFAEHGINFTTNDVWFSQFGQRIAVFNEEGTGIPNHLIYKLTDSLALADLMGSLDPDLTLETVRQILNASAFRPNESLERCLDALRWLLLVDRTGTQIGDDGGALASRTDYHRRLAGLRDVVGHAATADYRVISLVDRPADSLLLAASSKSSPESIAYRFALQQLSPFALVGHDYALHNDSRSLELFVDHPRSGTLTQRWLA